jgi:hypothetical protein
MTERAHIQVRGDEANLHSSREDTIVDAVYDAVLYQTGDAHQARWDAYWTLMTLLYPKME